MLLTSREGCPSATILQVMTIGVRKKRMVPKFKLTQF